jgi:hypothetical protein
MTRRRSGVKRGILVNVILRGEDWLAEGGPVLAVEESLLPSADQMGIGIPSASSGQALRLRLLKDDNAEKMTEQNHCGLITSSNAEITASPAEK